MRHGPFAFRSEVPTQSAPLIEVGPLFQQRILVHAENGMKFEDERLNLVRSSKRLNLYTMSAQRKTEAKIRL